MGNSEQPANRDNRNSMAPLTMRTYRENFGATSKEENRSGGVSFNFAEFYGCLCHRATTDIPPKARPHTRRAAERTSDDALLSR
jgi:hypothetical protein